MKKKLILLPLLFLILFFNSLFSQNSENNYFVVRVNPKLLNWDVIDNPKKTDGELIEFLNNKGNEKANKLKLNSIKVEKIFAHLFTADSISISRQGNKVFIPPFWATFRFYTPDKISKNEFYKYLINAFPLIIYVDSPVELEYLDIPNDTLYASQKSLNGNVYPNAGININEAWDIEVGKKHIKVGVFDSGIDSLHIDLDVIYGHKYSNPSFTGIDDTLWGNDYGGHGTKVAGIIGAKRNNGYGIAGIAGGNYFDIGEGTQDGISLFDFDLGFSDSESLNADMMAMGIIDAARSPETYHDWGHDFANSLENYNYNYNYFRSALGYGIHIGNHSYSLRILEIEKENKDLIIPDSVVIDYPAELEKCNLCLEAFLFSLKNGVVNVVARGNGAISQAVYGLNINQKNYPQRLDDSWILTTGVSGNDGKRLHFPINTAFGEAAFSPIGMNIDVIAPGSASIVISTRSSYLDSIQPGDNDTYTSFNGSSAAAPHVSGVAALLLSKYNKPCYSNQNLDPADVEYIIQQSATNLGTVGYNDSVGFGRLNAHRALQMIDFPKYQIIHPTEDAVSSVLLEQDTIITFLNDPFYMAYNGPLGSQFPLQNNKNYKVIRYKYRNTYDFSTYLSTPNATPAVELLDAWIRHSQTNSLGRIQDTVHFWNGNPAQQSQVIIDTFRIEPMAQIVSQVGNSIVLDGYYYHFIEVLFNDYIFEDYANYWYPINPFSQNPKMAYSIYIKDSLTTSAIDFPCYSPNVLLDPAAGLQEFSQHKIEFQIYPNPGNEHLFVSSLSHKEKAEIRILDAFGRTCISHTFSPNKANSIATQHLAKGLYLIEISSNNSILSSKKWVKL